MWQLGNRNQIKLLAYDFDGVMTDNKVYVDQNGNEMVQVNRADGLGILEVRKLGIHQVIISTEENPVVAIRARKLGLPYLQGIEDKALALSAYSAEKRIPMEAVAYVGNDINDLEVMKLVGTTFCPADAQLSIKNISNYVLKSNGGEGVVREIIDLLKERYIFSNKLK